MSEQMNGLRKGDHTPKNPEKIQPVAAMLKQAPDLSFALEIRKTFQIAVRKSGEMNG